MGDKIVKTIFIGLLGMSAVAASSAITIKAIGGKLPWEVIKTTDKESN